MKQTSSVALKYRIRRRLASLFARFVRVISRLLISNPKLLQFVRSMIDALGLTSQMRRFYRSHADISTNLEAEVAEMASQFSHLTYHARRVYLDLEDALNHERRER